MAKLGLQQLASFVATKSKLSEEAAAEFINLMVGVLNDGLRDEKMVKIKGLGTFKVIEVKDRESVDVNTGERIVIEGRNKITFTPDAVMKELVNKPFSQFETVVLNDGVEFADIENTGGDDASDTSDRLDGTDVQENMVESEVTPVLDSVNQLEVSDNTTDSESVEIIDVPHQTPEITEEEFVPVVSGLADMPDATDAPGEEKVEESVDNQESTLAQIRNEESEVKEESNVDDEEFTESSLIDVVDSEDNQSADEVSAEEVAKDDETEEGNVVEDEEEEGEAKEEHLEESEPNEDSDMDENNSGSIWGRLVGFLFVALIAGAIGFYLGRRTAPKNIIPVTPVETIDGALSDSLESDSVRMEDSIRLAKEAKIKAKVDSVTRAHEARNESIRISKSNQKADAKVAAEAKKTVQQTAQPATTKPAAPAPLPQGDNSQALSNARTRVNTGAYTIVGTQETVTVKKGQSMKSISKFYFGPDMECYVQAYNGVAEVKEGMKLRIPKLQMKKKK